MKEQDEFKMTNELLEKVLGGSNALSNAKIFTFTGDYAVRQAQTIDRLHASCACGCGCQGGAGGGTGAG